ncbi:MAG: hypothetical protein ACXVJ1_16680, partial [Candidatus Angelobacter sp.]
MSYDLSDKRLAIHKIKDVANSVRAALLKIIVIFCFVVCLFLGCSAALAQSPFSAPSSQAPAGIPR